MDLQPNEIVVIDCRELARPGVPFQLVVTDRRVSYARLVSFKRHRAEIVRSNLPRPESVVLRRRSPWVLWGIGACLFAFALLYVGWFFFGDGERSLHFEVCGFSFLLAFGCFAGGRSRWVLTWRDGERRHRVAQPVSYQSKTRAAISSALLETAELLRHPERLLAAVEEVSEKAAVDAPDDPEPDPGERRLCSDGSCTGLVGADARCRTCGKPG